MQPHPIFRYAVNLCFALDLPVFPVSSANDIQPSPSATALLAAPGIER